MSIKVIAFALALAASTASAKVPPVGRDGIPPHPVFGLWGWRDPAENVDVPVNDLMESAEREYHALLVKWKAAYDREEARKVRRQQRRHRPVMESPKPIGEDRRPEHEKEGKTYEQWYKENAPIIPSG